MAKLKRNYAKAVELLVELASRQVRSGRDGERLLLICRSRVGEIQIFHQSILHLEMETVSMDQCETNQKCFNL